MDKYLVKTLSELVSN